MAETPDARLSQEELDEIYSRAEGWNDQLRMVGAGGAENAFELGCGLGLIPLIVLIIALWAFGLIPLILAAVFIVIGLLMLAGISMLLAIVARNSAIKRSYQSTVEPEIVQYLSSKRIPRQSFDNAASRSLPEDAALQSFLHPTAVADEDQAGTSG